MLATTGARSSSHCELINGSYALQLFEHALAPLADLPVREVLSASHILTDLVLPPPALVYDYLAS